MGGADCQEADVKRIMALIDFSEWTPTIVKLARDMARAFNSELHLVHIAESEFVESEVQEDVSPQAIANRAHHREMEILGMALKKEGVNAVTRIIPAKAPRDTVAGKILQEVARFSPDLIVIGTHGHGRLHQWLAGSVTDTVVRKAHCPVLLVPSRKNGL